MVHNKILFIRSSVKYRNFLEGPTWIDLRSPKFVVYTVRIVKFLFHIISEHLQKAMSPMFETETIGPFLIRKLKWGAGGHGPPSGYAPASIFTTLVYSEGYILKSKHIQNSAKRPGWSILLRTLCNYTKFRPSIY